MDASFLDSASAGDGFSVLGEYNSIIIDELDLSGAPVIGWIRAISDAYFIYSQLQYGWVFDVDESMGLSEDFDIKHGIAIHDWLTLVGTLQSNWVGREIASDTITIYDIVSGVKFYDHSLSDGYGITEIVTYELTLLLLEYLGFTELVQAIKSVGSTISDTLDETDYTTWVFPVALESILSVIDAPSITMTLVSELSDSVTINEILSLVKALGSTITESLSYAETISNLGQLYTAVYDTIKLGVVVELDGEVWECYVLNTPKFYPSIYSGFNFNSFSVYEDKAYGANDEGIFEITGSDDNGSTIHTGMVLNWTDFVSPNFKRFRKGYLRLTGDNPAMIFECDDGQRQVYAIDTNGKVNISSDLKSKKWKLSVTDFDSLDNIKLLPVILTK